MKSKRVILWIIFAFNTLILTETTRYLWVYSFGQKRQITPVTKPAPLVIPVPQPLNIEEAKIEVKKKYPLPPLPKGKQPKPAETIKTEPRTLVVRIEPPVAPPAPAIPEKLALDDFNEVSKYNKFGGTTGTFGGTGGFCLESFQKGNTLGLYEEGGSILKLVFNVNNGYAGYYSKLNGIDLTPYRYISFLIRGVKGNEIFEVELGDGVNASKIEVREYLNFGAGTAWQKVSIPLKAFREVKQWNKMKGNFAIVFENYMGPPYSSTVYVDNVTFEK